MMELDPPLSYELQVSFPIWHLSLILPWRNFLLRKEICISFHGLWILCHT